MSFDAVNGQAIPASPPPPPSGGILPEIYIGSFERLVPVPGFLRLDVQVAGGDAYLQIKETIDVADWPPPTSEFLLPEGTHSIPLIAPAYGWRLRSASSTGGVTVTYARTFGA